MLTRMQDPIGRYTWIFPSLILISNGSFPSGRRDTYGQSTPVRIMITPKTKRSFCITNGSLIFANTFNIAAFLLCSIIVCRFIKNIFNCLILMNYFMTVAPKFDVYRILRQHLHIYASNIIFLDIFFY